MALRPSRRLIRRRQATGRSVRVRSTDPIAGLFSRHTDLQVWL
jgi:hypothetical protein